MGRTVWTGPLIAVLVCSASLLSSCAGPPVRVDGDTRVDRKGAEVIEKGALPDVELIDPSVDPRRLLVFSPRNPPADLRRDDTLLVFSDIYQVRDVLNLYTADGSDDAGFFRGLQWGFSGESGGLSVSLIEFEDVAGAVAFDQEVGATIGLLESVIGPAPNPIVLNGVDVGSVRVVADGVVLVSFVVNRFEVLIQWFPADRSIPTNGEALLPMVDDLIQRLKDG